jgi:enamine deaminase RidA (YjgF/YER057c/UK114 family)
VVSGTAPIWPDGSCRNDAKAQARRCFEIIGAALEELGASLDDVVRTRMYLVDPGHAHAEAMGRAHPAATMVIVAGLLDSRWRVEIEAEAEVTNQHELQQQRTTHTTTHTTTDSVSSRVP